MPDIWDIVVGIGYEEAAELLISASKSAVLKVKTASEWKKIFVNCGQSFIENESEAEPLLDELSLVLSRENMKQLAKDSKGISGYGLKTEIMSLLMNLMGKYDIPHEYAELYSEKFLDTILQEIAIKVPDKFDRVFQQEWREEQENQFGILYAELTGLSNDMRRYLNQRININYAGQMDLELKRSTENPSIGIEFFKVDDEKFQEKFKEQLSNELIYVRGRCREETIYCILNELWRLNESRPIYVVKSIDSWEKLREISSENNIYIPWFDTEEIVAIANNANIFVLNENMPAYTRDVIELRPRTIDTLSRCLNAAGMDYKDANALLKDTHGLYIPMKKHLFRGQYLEMPEWVDKLTDKAKKTCLLLGQWEEVEGDKLIIECLYGDTYESFLKEVTPYTKGEEPFLYAIKSNRSVGYFSLASTENTWECIDVSMEDPLWEKFIELFLEVINESEELFTYSGQERLLAQLNGEKLFWSETIRKGMMRTLIVKAFYRESEQCQPTMDQLVDKILGCVKDAKQWIYISTFWTDLCEISPRAILDRLNQEFDKPTGLLSLFENQTSDILFSRNPYINILWGVEQLLTQTEFAWDALRWLVKLDACNYKYVSNSPKGTLEKVFCPWYNFSAIRTPEEKISAAESACATSDNVWKYLCDAISHSGKNIVGTLSTPKYRDHLAEKETTIAEYRAVFMGYFQLLLERTEFSAERWTDMLSLTEDIDTSLRKEVFNRFLDDLTQMSDYEIIEVKDNVRDIIYRHRYYASSSWALSEDQLLEYERLLNNIHTCQPEYEYEYLFHKGLDFPLLHPVPFDEPKERKKENEVATEELIRESVIEFQKNKHDLGLLAEICAQKCNSSLGEYLAKFWKDEKWDLESFRILLTAQDSGEIAIEYMTGVFKKDVNAYPDLIAKVKDWGYSDELISKIYRAEAVWTETTPLVEHASEDIKVLFWNQPLPLRGCNARWALDESKKYASLETFLCQMYWFNNESPLQAQEIYDYFNGLESMRHSAGNRTMGWQLEQFLEILQKEFLYDEERCIRISKIEIYFLNLIEWEHMKCFSQAIKRNPEVFVEIVAGIFKRDHEPQEKPEGNEQYYCNMQTVFNKAEFCPAEQNGEVNEEELRQWVEKFRILLKDNDQESLFGSLLGRLFSFSPIGKDGYRPCEEVRNVIEEYSDDIMIREYAKSIFFQRGIYSPSAGKEEMHIAKEFKEEAEYLQPNYPKTAEIFYLLSHQYERESDRERTDAENGRF